MHVFKWTNPRFYLCFAPDGDGAPAVPSGGGDGGSSVPASTSAGDGGGSAPTASPAPTPEPAPSAAAATPEPSPWANLGSNDDLDALPVPEIAPVVPPVAPVAPVATPPVQQTQPPVEPQAQPGAPTPPAPGTEVPQALSPSDPVGIAAAIEQNRDAVIAHLATTKFALSETDLQELETDVAVAVPKLLGRVFMESQVAMQKFLAQAVPGMIDKYQTVTRANGDAESKFFESHKALGLDSANPQHRAAASRIASIYRQANPGIKLEQLIAEVGPMVAAAVRAQPGAPTPQVNPGAGPAPQMPRGGTPFRPAVNGGGGAPPVPAADPNPWSGLGQEFE